MKLTKVYTSDEFIPEHIFIMYKNHRLISIYQASACVSYNEYKNMRIASIHTLLRMYLSMMLSSYNHFSNSLDSIECLVNTLSIYHKKLSKSKRILAQEIIGQCYGSYKGLVTMRRDRLLRIAK